MARLPGPVAHLLAVHWCDSEVCNGGFHQFLSNSTGILAPEAVVGFRAIGALTEAGLLEKGMALIGEPYPRQRSVRSARLEELRKPGRNRKEWDVFYELDDQFYDATADNQLYALMDRYAALRAG